MGQFQSFDRSFHMSRHAPSDARIPELDGDVLDETGLTREAFVDTFAFATCTELPSYLRGSFPGNIERKVG